MHHNVMKTAVKHHYRMDKETLVDYCTVKVNPHIDFQAAWKQLDFF